MTNDQLPEVPDEWQRKPDRNGKLPRGRLSTRELQEQAAYNDLRQRLIEAIRVAEQRDNSLENLAATITQLEGEILGLKRELEITHGKASRRIDQISTLEHQKMELMKIGRLWAQLALMMPDSEPKSVAGSFGHSIQPKASRGESSRRYTLRNKYGTFEFTFNYYGSCTLKVVPSEGMAAYMQPFEMSISQGSLSADQVRQLTGTFRLSGQFVPEDTKPKLHGNPQKAIGGKVLGVMNLTEKQEAERLEHLRMTLRPRLAG